MGTSTSKQSGDPTTESQNSSSANDVAMTIGGDVGVTPLWKATTAFSDPNSISCPLHCQLWGPRHHQGYAKRTLSSSSLGNHSEILKIQTGLWGGILLLKFQEQILAVVKHKKIYHTMPCYENQPPSKRLKYKGIRLYEYAQLRESNNTKSQKVVSIVQPTISGSHRRAAFVDQFTIVNGPKNEYSKQLFQWQKTIIGDDDVNNNNNDIGMMQPVLAAEWKYADGCTSTHIHIANIDVAMILLLIPMSELLDTEIQMRELGRRAIIG